MFSMSLGEDDQLHLTGWSPLPTVNWASVESDQSCTTGCSNGVLDQNQCNPLVTSDAILLCNDPSICQLLSSALSPIAIVLIFLVFSQLHL